MLSPLAIKIGSAALIISASFGLGWKICSWKNDSGYKRIVEAQAKQLNEANQRNQQLQQASDALKADYQKKIEGVNEKVKTEIKLVPVYQSCIVPDSGLQLCKSAATNTNQAITS